MSRTRLVSSVAAALGVLAAACWLVSGAIPLAAAPAADSPGVTVELGGATLLHRAPVIFPDTVREKGVQGTVVVQLRIDGSGNVADAQVLSGPDELRKPVLQSVLNWHFTPNLAGSTHQAIIAFNPSSGDVTALVGRGPALGAAVLAPAVSGGVDRTVSSIRVVGLPDETAADLESRLPVHQGDRLTVETMRQLVQTVHNFDEHLAVNATPGSEGAAAIFIVLPPALQVPAVRAEAPATQARIRVGGNVQSTKLVSQPKPVYPALAKQARIQGAVNLRAVIGKDGAVEDLTLISGHPLLAPAAEDAVRQWVYQPTLLNGNPVEVETQIDVNFTLTQ